VLVVESSKYGLACDTLSSEHVLALILKMITGSLFKMVSNWRVLTKVATNTCSEQCLFTAVNMLVFAEVRTARTE
jgi:hypothetical protein